MTRRAGFLILLMLAAAADGSLPWRRDDGVTMVGSLESSELRTNEVLRIRRMIRNGGSHAVFVSWVPGMPSFMMRDSLGQRACFTDGPFTLVAAVVRVAPGDSIARTEQWPLRSFSNCGPANSIDARVPAPGSA